MMLYKLTDENDQTRNNTQWGPGVTHTASGRGKLCASAWIHAYRDPILAVLMNLIHANFKVPHLWEAEGEVGIDDGMRVGCTSLTTLRQIPVPEISTGQRIRFGILVAQCVYHDPKWNTWADDWLSGKDRSTEAAAAARAVRG